MKKISKVAALILCFVFISAIFTGCAITQEQKLVGSWRDTTGSIGYDFYENGTATIHYADFVIPIINYRYDGSVSATYTTLKAEDGTRHINLHYNIIGSLSVDEDFVFTIKDSVLTITNVKTNNTYTLTQYETVAGGSSTSGVSASQ